MDHHQQFVTCLDGVLLQRLLALEKDKPVSFSSNLVIEIQTFSPCPLFYCFLHSFFNFAESEYLEPQQERFFYAKAGQGFKQHG